MLTNGPKPKIFNSRNMQNIPMREVKSVNFWGCELKI